MNFILYLYNFLSKKINIFILGRKKVDISIDKIAHSDKPSSVFQPIIYLCIASSCPFVSFHEAPLPKFGFHPCRVYLFSLFFSKDIVSVALYDLSTMPDGLGLRSVVSQATCIY